MEHEALNWAKKAKVLLKILTNYRTEKQALLTKNAPLFQQVLKERAKYIEQLQGIQSSQPSTPLTQLQHYYVQQLIERIQFERNSNNKFFHQ